MLQSLSANYYQENKERLSKKAGERYQNLSKEEKKRAKIWSWLLQKIFQKMKNKILLSIEKRL